MDDPYHPSAATLSARGAFSAGVEPQPTDGTPRWFIRTLAALGIGGGSAGLAIVAWVALISAPSLAILIFVPVSAAYVFGIYCGVAALRRSRHYLSRNAWFYWLQVPVLSSPAFAYAFVSGAQVVVGIAPPRLFWNARLI